MGIDGLDRSWRLSARAKDNERLEPKRCERLSGTSHQACLGDGFGQGLRRPVSMCFFRTSAAKQSNRGVEGDTCLIFKVMTQ